MAEFSKRRKTLVFSLSLLTLFLAVIWYFLARHLEMNILANYILGATCAFLVSAFLSRTEYLTLARIVYILAFNFSVAITSSFIGKAGSVEFILFFGIGLPFIMFSFIREKFFVIIFPALSASLWFSLYLTDFNLFTTSKMDQDTAGQIVYPVSIGSTVLLVTFQLVYFSVLNARYFSKIHNKRQEAIEANNSKSRFLSTMSHEIRTPLNAITGLSHILADSNPRPDQVKNIEALNYSGKILLSLVNNVLDYSKMESTEIELDPIPTKIALAVEQIKKIHEASCFQKGVTMRLIIDKDLPTVMLDVVRFNQVINNLVSNAIKFTDRGTVTLRIKKREVTDNSVELYTEITDTGIGLSEIQKEKIWDAFTQASSDTNRLYGGTGLGLPIVKSIINAMGSEVYIDSELGKGSKFHFTLTLPIATENDTVDHEPKDHDLKGKHLLLVEDNKINVMVGKQILEKANLVVDVAYNGSEAVKKVHDNPYDLVLMDIQMPIMDGYDATKKIRKFNKDIPILALSASVFVEVKNKIYESGMNGFIFKPFDPKKLLNEIESELNKSV